MIQTQRAHRSGICHWCGHAIATGEELFPVLLPVCHLARARSTTSNSTGAACTTAAPGTSPNGCKWVHYLPCAVQVFDALQLPLQPPPCRRLAGVGKKCPLVEAGEQCMFAHHHEGLTPASLVSTSNSRRGRHKPGQPTASVFRAWLLDAFGHEYLQSSCASSNIGVLDVAGGKGTLAFQLENLVGVQTWVVDPRPLALKQAVQKWNSGFYNRAKQRAGLNACLTHYDPSRTPRYPGHLRIFLTNQWTQRFLQFRDQRVDNESSSSSLEQEMQRWWDECRDEARLQTWTNKGLQQTTDSTYYNTTATTTTATTTAREQREKAEELHDDDDDDDDVKVFIRQHKDYGKDDQQPQNNKLDLAKWLANAPSDVANATQAMSVVANCTAIVGLHPDQATEAAVDLALALNKPFAVVPCCVFSKHAQFSKRRLKCSGKWVQTTDDLIQYLREKDDRIQVDTLPFQGKNNVVFMTPDQCHRQADGHHGNNIGVESGNI